ncbi:MAG TPA: prolyl oligopeptidase family serine peptidase [Solirubrobacteraceae bacterium]|nr:prolyl oligopeptidase family serine peptidase [Solirubrobacteraceae bacterium]
MRRRRIAPRFGVAWVTLVAALILWGGAGVAAAQVPAGLPPDVPAAAAMPAPALPEPSATAWPFPSTFPQTSGTGRLAGGASLWSDFIYDDYGASSPQGITTSTYAQSSGLAGRQGEYVYPAGPADNNGADIFRAGIGLTGAYSYWRVDWVTLADPTVPIAEWTFDTDNNPATGASVWPAQAGVSSPGIDQALVVSSRGAWLINPVTGIRTDVLSQGGKLTIDPASKSFIVAIPRSALPVSGAWRVRLAAGLADSAGQNFAPPDVETNGTSTLNPAAERVYNITFRTVAQEPPVYTDGSSDSLIAAAEAALAANPVGNTLGADGIARSITGNFWMEDDQADTLAGGDVAKFSLLVDWSQLAVGDSTPEPQPTGYSARWYVSRLHPGSGQVTNDGTEGNFKPTLLDQVQPYAVYVPTTYTPGSRTPLTWLLHSLEVNYNQYGALDPQLIRQLCQDRGSICATTEGFGPAGWYYNEAETDFWQVWRQLAQTYTLDPSRTVISGYSMGGWASYKLAFEHPDAFAGALVLDGPVICGVQAYPGVNGFAYQDPACSQDGQSSPLVANARWIPYVIDQTYADELVPTTGVLSQAQAFDRLGQRYNLLIHTGADHLAFATEDRFGDAVAALGRPLAVAEPGAFTYDWYPSLTSSALGIGATGDYWLSGLSARDSSYGKIASIQAGDSALPDPSVTVQRSGTSLVTQPLPGTETQLSWSEGARPAAARRMSLALGDVSALTVDTAAAKLPTGTVNVTSDGPVQLAFSHLRPGTPVLVNGRRVTGAGKDGAAAVNLPTGRSVVVLGSAAAAATMACSNPAPRLTASSLGPVRLGMTRRQARSRFPASSTRRHRYMDFFCPARRGIRVGYASPPLLRSLPRGARRPLSGRVVLILTAALDYSLRGAHVRTRLARVARRLHTGTPIDVGRNRWYVVPIGAGHGVLKVQHGVIAEIGIANKRLTTGRRAARRFFTSFS